MVVPVICRHWVVPTQQISPCAINHRSYRFFLQRWTGRYVLLREPRHKNDLRWPPYTAALGTALKKLLNFGSVRNEFRYHPIFYLRAASSEDGMDTPKNTRGTCPRCGGELEFKDTCESPITGSRVHFFKCEDCGHVHTIERRSA